jgi:uncharacterized protein YqeY
MKLINKIEEELKIARYNKNQSRVTHITTILGEISRSPSKDRSDEFVLSVIKKALKQAEQMNDLVNDKNISELKRRELQAFVDTEWSNFLKEWLPKQATLIEVEQFVDTIDLTAFRGNIMRAMGIIMSHFKGNVDGNMVKSILLKKAGKV